MIVHLVLFNPKPAIPDDKRAKFVALLQETCRSIHSVKRAVIGRKTDIEAGYARVFGDKTYEFAAVVEFEDRSGLVEYLQHPLHQSLGAMFWELCESTIVVEFEAVDAVRSEVASVLG